MKKTLEEVEDEWLDGIPYRDTLRMTWADMTGNEQAKNELASKHKKRLAEIMKKNGHKPSRETLMRMLGKVV
jgi:hypothetical protein